MRQVLLLVVVLLIGFAPAPFPRPARTKPKVGNDMVGYWGPNGQLMVTEDVMFYYPPGGNEYVLKVNANASPKTYDITGKPGGNAAGREYVGIYKIEGDTLTLCYVGGKTGRPTSFQNQGITEVYKLHRR